jgi:hypothetical protein
MDTTNEPIEAISKWQEWYRSHRIVAEMDVPLVTKDSRENMHDTTNATATLEGGDNQLTDHYKTMYIQKAQEHFADTIAEFTYELSGKELYKAFYAAAMDNLTDAEKEYQKAKQLVDMLRHNNVAP